VLLFDLEGITLYIFVFEFLNVFCRNHEALSAITKHFQYHQLRFSLSDIVSLPCVIMNFKGLQAVNGGMIFVLKPLLIYQNPSGILVAQNGCICVCLTIVESIISTPNQGLRYKIAVTCPRFFVTPRIKSFENTVQFPYVLSSSRHCAPVQPSNISTQ